MLRWMLKRYKALTCTACKKLGRFILRVSLNKTAQNTTVACQMAFGFCVFPACSELCWGVPKARPASG